MSDELGLTTDPSLLEYTKREGGSCELFKIEIKHIPTYANYKGIKKFIENKFKVKPQKIKLGGSGRSKIAFVSFSCEKDRDVVLKNINETVWKGNKLEAAISSPLLDPYLVKQAENVSKSQVLVVDDNDDGPSKNKRFKDASNEIIELESIEDQLKAQVAPFTGKPYDEQLAIKKQDFDVLLQGFLRIVGKIIDKSSKSRDRRPESRTEDLLKWYIERKKTDHIFCPIGGVIECPVDARVGYRNKCEFSFGTTNGLTVIGFRLGAYKDGSISVGSVDSCSIVPLVMKKIVNAFQQFLNDAEMKSQLKPFDHVTHQGNLTQLTVKSNLDGQSMIILFVDKTSLSIEIVMDEISKISKYLQDAKLGITSFFLQLVSKNSEVKPELIFGESTLMQELTVKGFPLKFKVSPNAFFQINTKAAETCYGAVCDLLNDNIEDSQDEIAILDICCGTGTIGLCLASKCNHVFGIELSKEAVSDAKENAALNNISNVTFYDGKAETLVPLVIQSIQKKYPKAKVVAILDPPRAGLNSSVIRSLRSNTQISRVLYVSCEPRLAKDNIIDLVRPASKAYRGDPFIPIKSVLVDMFPDTKRAETLFFFERLKPKEQTKREI